MPVTPDIPAQTALPSTFDQLTQQFADDPILGIIRKNLPAAFTDASPEDRQAYRRALQDSRHARVELKTLLKPLKSLTEFAEPLLRQALDTRFGPGLNPKTDRLFHPTLKPSGATGPATRFTLLEAALHNFERKESAVGGFLKSAGILNSEGQTHPKNIAPEQFADVCRHLNIGRKYQDHLQDVLEPDDAPGTASNVARDKARAVFIANDLADMALYAQAAYLRKHIGKDALDAVLAIASRRPDPQFGGLPVMFEALTLFGVEIPRAVIIKPQATWTFTQVPLLLYIPQDPISPFKTFASLTELEDDLRSRLLTEGYQAFFAQLIGERNRAPFFDRLNRRLYPLSAVDGRWFAAGLRHRVADHQADLELVTTPIYAELTGRMYQQQIAMIKDNARFLAVPTEDEDEKSRRERLQPWIDLELNLFMMAASFVPVLGQMLMVYAAVELVSEVYLGVADLSHGDFDQAFDHLDGVAANIAFMALLGSAAAGAEVPEPPAIPGNQFDGEVIPIQLRNGQARLWKPDLAPFACSHVLPEGLTPTVEGVVEHDGKHYIALDGQRYEVQRDPALDKWTLKHPHDDHPFAPVLEHNGVGAFRVEGELPEQWAQDRLFRRLGHSVSGLSESRAEHILSVTGVDTGLLRQVHGDSGVPPGQLRDTIKRFQLDATLEHWDEAAPGSRAQEFEQLYAASEQSKDPAVALIRRDFPLLPTAVADDLLVTLTAAEKQQMLDSGRVPLRVGEAAAWQQRQTRLNRAFEGFYLDNVAHLDTEILGLHLLETLPGWTDQVRLEVRKDSPWGPLLDSLGRPEAPQLKKLVKSNGRYQAFDADNNALNSVPRQGDNLYDSILHALPDGPRRALGFPHVAQGPELKAALANRAMADRAQASKLLGMREAPLKFNLPRQLSQGRVGYALSGRGRLPGFVSEDHLLWRIGSLELQDVSAQDVLTALRLEGLSNADINARLDVLQDERQALRAALDQWTLRSAELLNPDAARLESRTRIGQAIQQHWQVRSIPGPSQAAVLRLEMVQLRDFPAHLPSFFYASVERLEMLDVASTAGEPSAWAVGTAGGTDVLETFLGRFTRLRALEISRSPNSGLNLTRMSDLPRIVTTQLPGLRSLSLIRQGLELNAETLNRFGRLPELQRLDLSGNHHLASIAPGAVQLDLERLGLDSLGLSDWPAWLDALVPGRIAEVSLVDNRINQLPHQLLLADMASARPCVIRLLGNRLPRSEMIELSLRSMTPGRAVRIDPGLPPILQPVVRHLLNQQAQMEAAIRDWVDASSSRVPLSEDAIAARRRLGISLIDHWRGSVSGRESMPVLIDSTPLSEFPRLLPETFYSNVNSLALRNVAVHTTELDAFLVRFQELTSLEIDGHVTPMTRLPNALSALPVLRELSLTDQGLLIDQAAMDYLSSLPTLRHLDLSGNRLGEISTSPMMRRHWDSITLNNAGIDTWPQWLDAFLPGGIDVLSLAQNQLTELPDALLRNRSNHVEHTEISLEGNPLTRETLIRAHTSEYGGHRSFSFYMDLPQDIREMPPEQAWSSSESDGDTLMESDSDSDASQHRHGPTGRNARTGIDPWLEGTHEALTGYQQIWDQLQLANDAPMLLALIHRLQETADYLRAHDALLQRVWHVLGAAADDPQLRQLLNAMAEEAIANRTCGDGVRLEFNQMEVQVFARDSLRNIPDAERGPTLYRLARRLYRLDEVDRLARANSAGRDEAEVRLAYRLRLADSLDLPLPPARMLYRTAAAVTADELQMVEATVLDSQGSPEFLSNLLGRDFWASWLREAHGPEFTELQATFEVERARLEDEYPQLDDAYFTRIAALDADQKARELELLKQLTYQEGIKYDD